LNPPFPLPSAVRVGVEKNAGSLSFFPPPIRTREVLPFLSSYDSRPELPSNSPFFFSPPAEKPCPAAYPFFFLHMPKIAKYFPFLSPPFPACQSRTVNYFLKSTRGFGQIGYSSFASSSPSVTVLIRDGCFFFFSPLFRGDSRDLKRDNGLDHFPFPFFLPPPPPPPE